jgi:hypothetical protein
VSKRIFVPTSSADDWKQFLVEPEKQWRTGFSARTLAHCWESAEGFPDEVYSVFAHSNIKAFENLEILMAFPEYKVDLPGGGRPSQNDLFVLAKDIDGELITIAVEGKVSETFGPTLAEWNQPVSKGKTIRFEFLQNLLGLKEIPSSIRYQLLHRSASAILEAQKFNAKSAVMLVHSFSQEMLWLDDFQSFASLFEIYTEPGKLYFLKDIDGIRFYVAWIKGDKKYLVE